MVALDLTATAVVPSCRYADVISAATSDGSGAAVIRARRSAAARAMAARSPAGSSPSAPRIAPD